MLITALIDVVGYLINIIVSLVIVQFVLSLLIAFNVVSLHNNFVAGMWRAINVLLEPLLRPIRRIMPDTGMIDFSPMALIIGLNIVIIVLNNLRAAYP